MNEFRKELEENILPFWIEKMEDKKNGGFFGRIDGDGVIHSTAPKGAVLNTRLLWTFSAAYRVLRNPVYLQMAERSFQYIVDYFIDKKNGGVYWELDYQGKVLSSKKQTYAQGFALYGFSEYYRACGNPKALDLAKEFFFLIEKKCRDKKAGGYWEAFTEDWNVIEDMRLSDKDANECKTMNTHLHVLEPYTNLCRIWDSKELREAQREMIVVFTDKILDKQSGHLNLFFDDNWTLKSETVSYGHDIEASWLLMEAAEVLGDAKLIDQVKPLSLKIADASAEGLELNGSMIYEKTGSHLDYHRHWWVQAEAIVGFMYAWRHSGEDEYRNKAFATWRYIQKYLVDSLGGEWFLMRDKEENLEIHEDKAGFWKCSYHNSRMCLEMIENF